MTDPSEQSATEALSRQDSATTDSQQSQKSSKRTSKDESEPFDASTAGSDVSPERARGHPSTKGFREGSNDPYDAVSRFYDPELEVPVVRRKAPEETEAPPTLVSREGANESSPGEPSQSRRSPDSAQTPSTRLKAWVQRARFRLYMRFPPGEW